MSLSIGQIVLYSRKSDKLATFLSQLLDMEISASDNGVGILLSSDTLKVSIMPSSADHLFASEGERDLIIDFFLDSLDELEDLLHKAQFIMYRQGLNIAQQKNETEKKIQLSKVGPVYFFNLKDSDGRKWKFSYREESSN